MKVLKVGNQKTSLLNSGDMFDSIVWDGTIATSDVLSNGTVYARISGLSNVDAFEDYVINNINDLYVRANTGTISEFRSVKVVGIDKATANATTYLYLSGAVATSTAINTATSYIGEVSIVNKTTGDVYYNRSILQTGQGLLLGRDGNKVQPLVVGYAGVGTVSVAYGEQGLGGSSGSGSGGGGGVSTSTDRQSNEVEIRRLDIYNNNPLNTVATKHTLVSILPTAGTYDFAFVFVERGTNTNIVEGFVGYKEASGQTTADNTKIGIGVNDSFALETVQEINAFSATATATNDLEYITLKVEFRKYVA